jgi:HAD superfamily hydrolase (TIGR01509 family)
VSAPPVERLSADSHRPADLEPAANRWQRALDADYRALLAVDGMLPGADLAARMYALTRERHEAELVLRQLARMTGASPVPWIAQVPVTAKALGLPDTVEACIFDLDGVLTDSGVLHAWAWAETFDPFLFQLSEQAGWQFIPFDRDADYRSYVDGRPRLEGVHAFLTSRGIQLPDGRPDDPAGAGTAYGLARRKSDVLSHAMEVRGVAPLDGSRRYLEAAGRAGLVRAVVSASTRTLPMLELAGLGLLLEVHVDAAAISDEDLRPRPAPDLLLAACRKLGVSPEATVTLTNSPAGVAAGRSAGLTIVGVGPGDHGRLLQDFGAEHVVPSLDALLDHRVVARA